MFTLVDIISQTGPDMTSVSIPVWMDLAAVMVGAISGILVAQQKKLDLVGYIALAMLCGLGGGLIRDMTMQVGDVYMLKSPLAIPASVLMGIMGFYFPGALLKIPHLLEWVDIISVGLFVAAGTDKALVYGLNPWACVLMGTLTGVGGGMLRDTFLGDTPRIFKRGNFYAICAVSGAVVYYLLVWIVYLRRPWALVICVLVVVLLRRISLKYNVLSPAEVDLTPKVVHGAKTVIKKTKRGYTNRKQGEYAGRPHNAAEDNKSRHQDT